MKKSITRTPQSEEDAYETYRYIALDSVEAAEAYFDALFDTFDKLLEHPKMGTVVEKSQGSACSLPAHIEGHLSFPGGFPFTTYRVDTGDFE